MDDAETTPMQLDDIEEIDSRLRQLVLTHLQSGTSLLVMAYRRAGKTRLLDQCYANSNGRAVYFRLTGNETRRGTWRDLKRQLSSETMFTAIIFIDNADLLTDAPDDVKQALEVTQKQLVIVGTINDGDTWQANFVQNRETNGNQIAYELIQV